MSPDECVLFSQHSKIKKELVNHECPVYMRNNPLLSMSLYIEFPHSYTLKRWGCGIYRTLLLMLLCILFVVNLNTAKTLTKTTGYTIYFFLSAAYYSTVWVIHRFPGVDGHGKAVFQVFATRNSVVI